MSSASDERERAVARPRLRPVEVIRVVARGGGLTTLLRDAEQIAEAPVEVPAPYDRALTLMDGRRGVEDIARALNAGAAEAERVSERGLSALASRLEASAMLEGPTASRRRCEEHARFRAAAIRPAAFAGGGYHGDPGELRAFIAGALARSSPPPLAGVVRGLVAPHMDLWRAADGYGAAYAGLARAFPEDVETVVVLGTCHAGMRSPFAFTKKAFSTPLGLMRADEDFVDEVAARSGADILADEYKHRGEHSIEFQIVHLLHLLGARAREVRVVPVLCGLGRAAATRRDPESDLETARVMGAMLDLLARTSALVVAGADLAHVGPRFGDPAALNAEGRAALANRDDESLRRLMARDAGGFFEHVSEDLEQRRVCGTGPLYTLARALEAMGRTDAQLIDYSQHVDPDEGSVVSHASLAFTRA
ncbi:MAG: AmmeMemoRadiSam system protein B [Polyangiaceae bacterium]|nr:AmmeMemoRadiSam system protein B [Polyangiaceae bacterium]MBK8936100.1 AmmeMemoRadiSam system protein B [Polyangiaceae bacterium]